ncbi:MAG: hypothetical protein FWE74_03830 [Oscillospiraceae bacterium]|nr:hypothetical protein [Oscillospiraceae bacterium]
MKKGLNENMADNFYKHWFKGFENFVVNLDDENRTNVFKECGRACSDSYTKQVYIEEYKKSKSIDDFLDRLKVRFPEIGFNIMKKDEIIELKYSYCACDLVKNGYIKTALMCECSRQSLLYNWSSVFGEGNVTVQLHQSILEGKSCCKFTINLKQT